LSLSDFGFEFAEIFVIENIVYSEESSTPRIVESGESIFDYEYLREFEDKVGKAQKVV
jgi:hypothetical protein